MLRHPWITSGARPDGLVRSSDRIGFFQNALSINSLGITALERALVRIWRTTTPFGEPGNARAKSLEVRRIVSISVSTKFNAAAAAPRSAPAGWGSTSMNQIGDAAGSSW